MRTKTIGIAVLTLCLAFGLTARGGAVYVATNATPAAPHESWATAFTNVQDALDWAADPGNAIDTIYLAGHTFWLTNQIEWTTAGLTVAGGYEADPGGDSPGNHDPEEWPTILTRSETFVHRILHIDGADNSTLEHVTITGGSAQHGSGLLINNSQNVTLSGCIIADNRRRQSLSGLVSGGGLRAQSSSVTLTNCVVRGNRVDNSRGASGGTAYGGGIWSDGTLTLRDSRIQNNEAWTSSNQHRPAGGQGGGIYFNGVNMVMKNVLLAANDASGSGHGIRIQGGAADIKNASVVYQPGEGIRRAGGTVNISNSIVWGNWTDIEGSVNVSFSNIGDADLGGDNISADPRFEYGYYLGAGSPCLGAGSDTAETLGMDAYVRNIAGDLYGPSDTVNMGYHYPAGFDLTYADLYVATDGDDEFNSGLDAGSPLQSITKALSLAREGTRIHLATGIYSSATTGETFPLLAADKPGIQILGDDATNTILDAGNGDPRTEVLSVVRSHQSVLENITLTGGNRVNGAGLRVENSQRVQLTGCVIRDNAFSTGERYTYYGGGAFFSLSEITLTDCIIRDNAAHVSRTGTPRPTLRGGGIWSDGYLTLQNCRIVDNKATKNHGSASSRGGGLSFSGRRLEMRNVLVTGNQSECLASPGSGVGGDGVHVGNVWDERGLRIDPDQAMIENATIADNYREGIRRELGDVSILNSIVWDNDESLVGDFASVTYSNIEGAEVYAGENNINADPLFENAAAGDYRLQHGSPAIEAGLNQMWMADATDLGGLPRIMMGTVDMGCYEAIPPAGTLILLR